MSRILILSSFVSMGHVGLSAGQPVCQMLGVEVTAIPTIVLSNHPGWPNVARTLTPAEHVVATIDALGSNGWLAEYNAVLVGYMPSVEHVDAAVALLNRVRAAAPRMRVVVDPILGDRPKGLYVPIEVATAVRDRIVPLADVVTPNLFELEWLTGRDCPCLDSTGLAARELSIETAHVTSAPLGTDETGVLTVTRGSSRLLRTPRYEDVPHGIGDVFAALIAAGVPVEQALGHLHALARASRGKDHLNIIGWAKDWLSAPALSGDVLG